MIGYHYALSLISVWNAKKQKVMNIQQKQHISDLNRITICQLTVLGKKSHHFVCTVGNVYSVASKKTKHNTDLGGKIALMWKLEESFLVYYDSNSNWAINLKDSLPLQTICKWQGNEFKNWHISDYNTWKPEKHAISLTLEENCCRRSSAVGR